RVVDDERLSFVSAEHAGREGPRDVEILRVGRRDLRERAVATRRVIARGKSPLASGIGRRRHGDLRVRDQARLAGRRVARWAGAASKTSTIRRFMKWPLRAPMAADTTPLAEHRPDSFTGNAPARTLALAATASAMSELRDDLQSALGTSYTLERELGGGGMSRVFLAEETALGRKVVVKLLSPELLAGV